MTAFIFTFLLVAVLEPAAKDGSVDTPETEVPEETEICVGCEDEEKEPEPEQPPLKVEVRIDPLTGEVQYIIRGIVLE